MPTTVWTVAFQRRGQGREKGSERRTWMRLLAQKADTSVLKSSLSHYKGSQGGYSPGYSPTWGLLTVGSPAPPNRVNHSLGNWKISGALLPTPSTAPVLLQTPSFASCREQASGRGPSGIPVPSCSKIGFSGESSSSRGGEPILLCLGETL